MNNTQDEFIRLALEVAAKKGAESGIKAYKAEIEKNNKSRNDRRLKNTKMLLSHYRDFKSYAVNAIYNAQESDSAIDILDLMWDPYNRADLVVESIKASAIKTNIIIDHINEMLRVYESLCSKGNEAEQRRYNILYDRYISDDIYSIDEIADKYYIDRRTVYKDIDYSINRMAKLIFGIDFIVGNNNK